MSDALTDIARDQRRAENLEKFLELLAKYIENPKRKTRVAVLAAATATDEVRGGYWGASTDIVKDLEAKIALLLTGERTEWARILSLAERTHAYRRLKALSPFANDILIKADYGMDCLTFSAKEIDNLIYEIVRRRKLVAYDCDKYLIVLPGIDLKKTDAIWLDSGRRGVTGPRVKENS